MPATIHRGVAGWPARRPRPTTRAFAALPCAAATPASISSASDGSGAVSPVAAASVVAGAGFGLGAPGLRGFAAASQRTFRSARTTSGYAGAGAPDVAADVSASPGVARSGAGAASALPFGSGTAGRCFSISAASVAQVSKKPPSRVATKGLP